MHASHLETISEQFLRVTMSLFLGGQTYACIKNSYLVKFNRIMITMLKGVSLKEIVGMRKIVQSSSTIVLP